MPNKTQYVVTGACAMAKTSTAQGPRVLTFLEGATLPADVDQESIDHLLDVGLIAVVGSAQAKEAGPSGQQPQLTPEKPSGGGTPPVPMVAGDDPAGFTADQVLAYLSTADEDERARVLAAEEARGEKARKTVLAFEAPAPQ